MRNISRREFLKQLALGSFGAYLASRADRSSGQAAGRGGVEVIDQAPGPLFKDPVELKNVSSTAGVIEVNMEARPARVIVNNAPVNLFTYNGTCPGPTIRVKRGDRLKIHFRNSLPPLDVNLLGYEREMTNLHIHGLHVSPAGESGNPLLQLMSGEAIDYQFDLSLQEPGALTFYLPGCPGSVAEQLWGGMAGALVFEDEGKALSGYETHLLVLKDISLSAGAPEPYTSLQEYLRGKEGDTVMVNGQVNPVLPVRPGQVQRWRILNASTARFYKLGLEGHALHLIGTDGGPLDRPYPASSMLLSPGERLDVLVKADQTAKNYRLLSLPYDRGFGSAGQPVTLMTLSYKGPATADSLPKIVNPDARRLSADPAKTRRIVMSMGEGKGYINGRSFGDAEVSFIHSPAGTCEIWEIVNQSDMDRPFHQRLNLCQVLSINGGDPAYAAFYTKTPSWKDTVLVPRGGSVRLLVPVPDLADMSLFQCQIAEQADMGMTGVWDIHNNAANDPSMNGNDIPETDASQPAGNGVQKRLHGRPRRYYKGQMHP